MNFDAFLHLLCLVTFIPCLLKLELYVQIEKCFFFLF